MSQRLCYALLPTDTLDTTTKTISPIIIKEGEKGYYETDYVWNKENAQAACDELNRRLGHTPDDVTRLIIGSMSFPKDKDEE